MPVIVPLAPTEVTFAYAPRPEPPLKTILSFARYHPPPRMICIGANMPRGAISECEAEYVSNESSVGTVDVT